MLKGDAFALRPLMAVSSAVRNSSRFMSSAIVYSFGKVRSGEQLKARGEDSLFMNIVYRILFENTGEIP
jgi:hypothetical protein